MKLVKNFALIFILSTAMLTFFQNCSPSQNTGLLGGKSSGISEVQAINKDAPFAFDLVADTISYNSCVGVDLNRSGIHGIKIGVNEGFVDPNGTGAVKAGLKLRTDFLQYIGQKVTPIYPSSVITASQIQYILQNSTSNANAFIQYSVRKRSDLSVVLDLINPSSSSSFTVTPGRDGQIESANLTTDPVITEITKNVQFNESGTLLSEGPRIYNLYSASAARPIEASFGFSNYADETYDAGSSTGTEKLGFGEAYSDRIRQKFNSGANDKLLLTITYGDPTKGTNDQGLNTPYRKDETDKTKAYGRSYALHFEQASTKAGWRNNLLKQINESNLADNTPATGNASWSCENFVVMKQNQWNNSSPQEPACIPLIATDMQSSEIAGKVKRLRRHYLESNWNIGLFYGKNEAYIPALRTLQPLCLVPKTADCYLPTTNIIPNEDIGINYDPNTECYLYAASAMGVTYTNNPPIDTARRLGRCAQYASICVRSSTNY